MLKCRTYQSLLFPLETILKMVKEKNKRDVESICARVNKHASKKVVKLKLIWIDYEELIMDYLERMFISMDKWAKVFSFVWEKVFFYADVKFY